MTLPEVLPGSPAPPPSFLPPSSSFPSPRGMLTAPLELAVLVLALAQHAHAQIAEAQCEAGFEWMSNSRGQSPCLVAAYLNLPCSASASAYVASLDPDAHYVLSRSTANACNCNTVYYSMLSACGACQGRFFEPWPTWAFNCTDVPTTNQVYPNPIPPGTAVPAWAYMDIEAEGAFNLSNAQVLAEQQLPESTNAGPTSTSTLAPIPTDTATSSIPDTASATASPQAASRKSVIGPVVGGVVGGIGMLLLCLIILAIWLRHRKAKKTCPSAQYRSQSPGMATTAWMPDYERRNPTPGSVATTQKYYSPDDPTTFPETAHVPSMYSQTSQRESTYFTAQSGYQPAGVHYRGAPEF